MKKVIIFSLLVGVLTSGAFAQVTFSGEVHVGIQLQRDHNGNEVIDTIHRDEGMPVFDFTATVMRENYGARLDTTSRMLSDGGGTFTLNGIYGWVDFGGFFDNDSLRLTMGQISTAAWVTRLDASLTNHYFDEIRGFRIEYNTPIEGLSVGAAFRTDRHYRGGGMDAETGQTVPMDMDSFGRRIIFGVNFIHTMFSTVFAYDLSDNVSTLFGFNFTGIPDLTAGLQLRVDNLVSWDDPAIEDGGRPGMFQIHYKVGYRIIRPLNVFIILGQTFYGDHSGVDWVITPGITYRFLPNLNGDFRISLDNFYGNPDLNLTVLAAIEHTLRGPAVLYVEYELRLDNMDRVTHTFGFGITIRTF